MTDIEIIVSLVVLLGSLLLANIANNLADALRARRDLPIGFVPWAINFYLTAAFVSGLTLFWAGREICRRHHVRRWRHGRCGAVRGFLKT